MALSLPLPTEDVPHVTTTVSLDGTSYRFEYQWNARDGRWYVSISDADGVLIIGNRVLLIGWDLLKETRDLRRPPGVIIAVNSTNFLDGNGYGEMDPGYNDLHNGNTRLLYFTQAEVLANS